MGRSWTTSHPITTTFAAKNSITIPRVFDVVAGILPAVEGGILPPGKTVGRVKTLGVKRLLKAVKSVGRFLIHSG
jgi:hypothetical protein